MQSLRILSFVDFRRFLLQFPIINYNSIAPKNLSGFFCCQHKITQSTSTVSILFHTRLLCANPHGIDASNHDNTDPPRTESPFDGPKALQARWIRHAISPRFLGDSTKGLPVIEFHEVQKGYVQSWRFKHVTKPFMFSYFMDTSSEKFHSSMRSMTLWLSDSVHVFLGGMEL